MSFHTKLVNLFTKSRLTKIDDFRKHPENVQHKQLNMLLKNGSETEYCKRFGVNKHTDFSEFQSKVPVTDYDGLQHDIERVRSGEDNILWNKHIGWFAKSSGTTGDKSKFIPISAESLQRCHLQGGRDVAAIFADNYPDSQVFAGKTLTLGGSHQLDNLSQKAHSGDLSAILIQNTPVWADIKRLPKRETALLPDFEKKVQLICQETVNQNVTAFAGVPSWNLVLMNKVLEFTGKSNLREVWPQMELFIHGGVSFTPYRSIYERLIPSTDMKYMETYNASEGFFALQDDPADSSMLLMLDYGIFYEFLPMDSLADTSKCVPLWGVKTGVNYAMIITTNGGLWRYMIGDTVEFTSISPYKLKITGRTKHYINTFGEEIIVDNATSALKAACTASGAEIANYTAAPIFMDDKAKGGHQWLIEFERHPTDMSLFINTLDQSLQNLNSDYEAKRFKNTTLMQPVVTVARKGLFYDWMRSRGKLGGQNKVPVLANNRNYIDTLLEMNITINC